MSSDQKTDDTTERDILPLTAQIVAAHLTGNSVATDDIPALIRQVHETLAGLSKDGKSANPENLVPAVPVKKSVMPDYLICLEDGKKLKMLKRHLKTAYNMTPEEYREKWGLPLDYPMVAPNYAKKRSALARESGLGTQRKGD